MAEWVKAPEEQLALHRWMTSREGMDYRRSWVRHERIEEPLKADMYDALWLVECEKLLTAHAIWVDPEMTDLIEAARAGFKPEAMEREDFIVHTGFVYFAKPVIMLDRSKRKIPIGAFSWCPITFTNREPGDLPKTLTERGTEFFSHDPDLKEDVEGMTLALHGATNQPYSLLPIHFTEITFGDPLDDGHLLDPEGRATGADQWWKTIQTTLRLMQQRIAIQSDATIDRPTRRRWKRETKTEPKEMLVIRLRRPVVKKKDGEESEVNWSHRWLVDGHWRNQWYESLQRHRQIWIGTYMKGPDDKPLIQKRRFYKWDR